MNFRDMLQKLGQLSEATEKTEKGYVHKAEAGGYGRKFDTDEEGEEGKKKEPEVKRGRGRPRKGADETGNVKKYEPGALEKAMAPKGKKKGDMPKKPSEKHTLKDWYEMLDKELMNEATAQPIPVVDPTNKEVKLGTVSTRTSTPSDNTMTRAISDMLKTGAMTITAAPAPAAQQQQTAAGAKPAAGATGQAPAGQQQMKEKWGEPTKVAPEEKGKYKGKGIAELRSAYNKLKASGPHKKGSAEYGRMRELAFAIRAKTGWGKVSEEQLDEKAVSKAQQKFMGMVHAAQKGGKPASKEVAKVAKTMGKKDAKDFASTKHKGLPEKVKSKVKEGDIPSASGVDTMGAGLGAGRSNKTLEENMNTRLKAAYHEGRSHGLAKHQYNCRFDDIEEAKHYHAGYKEGLDECYGQGLYECGIMDEDSTMPQNKLLDAIQPTLDFAMSQGYNVKKGRGNSVVFLYDLGMGDQDVMKADVYFDRDTKEPWVNFNGIGSSGNDPANVFLDTFKQNHQEVMHQVETEKAYRDDQEFDEGNAFTAGLAKTAHGGKFSVGGKTFTDTSHYDSNLDEFAFESLDKQLNELLNEDVESVSEGMSVSISQGQQGSPDSVSITGTDNDADKLLAFVKQVGLGKDMAGGYEAPIDGSGPTHSHGDINVVDDHEGMMALMKKLSGMDNAGEEDYKDEEQTDQPCEVCGESQCKCDDDRSEKMDEFSEEMDSGIVSDIRGSAGTTAPSTPASGGGSIDPNVGFKIDKSAPSTPAPSTPAPSTPAPSTPAPSTSTSSTSTSSTPEPSAPTSGGDSINPNVGFKITKPSPSINGMGGIANTGKGGNPLSMDEEKSEQSNTDFMKNMSSTLGKIAKNSDEDESDNKKDDEDSESKNKEKKDLDESYANSADDTFITNADYMLNTISGGLNKPKRDQTTLPHTKVKVEGIHVSENADVLSELKRLSGLK